MTLSILNDAERLLSLFLRQDDDISTSVGDRVYTVLPAEPTWPLIRLQRWGGSPVIQRPLVLDSVQIQIDVWGDRKKQAQDIAQLVRAVLSDRLPWGNSTEGWLTFARLGNLRYLPDDSFDPPRPRYVIDLEAFVRSV